MIVPDRTESHVKGQRERGPGVPTGVDSSARGAVSPRREPPEARF